MLKTYLLAYLLFLCSTTITLAQADTVLPTAKKPNNFTTTLKLDNRSTFINADPVTFWGVRTGIIYKEIHEVSIGYLWLNKSLPILIAPSADDQNKIPAKLNFHYYILTYQPRIHKWRKLSWYLPTQIGMGNARVTFEDSQNKTINSEKIIIVEPFLMPEYALNRYFRLGAGAGYRFTFAHDQQLIETFSQPFYTFRLRIMFGAILKDKIIPRFKKK